MLAHWLFWLFLAKERLLKRVLPRLLTNFEEKVHSQNGEDGFLAEIFRRIGTSDRFFVEIGVGFQASALECNTYHLLLGDGWSGIWIDASQAAMAEAQRAASGYPVRTSATMLTAQNVGALFASLGVPREFDLLSIDIDGNDYWIWNALSAYRPRVVVVEYNAYYLRPWKMPYAAAHRWDGSNHFGASLWGWMPLAQRLGYELVGCESAGVNAFFVRRELAAGKFPRLPSLFHYSIFKYNLPHFGWPPRTPRQFAATTAR